MAIYNRFGAPVEIVDARKQKMWVRMGGGNIKRSLEPLPERKGFTVSSHDFLEVRVRVSGPYPDGTGGAKSEADADWHGLDYLVADDGFREIMAHPAIAAIDGEK